MCGKGKLVSDAGWKLVEYIEYVGSLSEEDTPENAVPGCLYVAFLLSYA